MARVGAASEGDQTTVDVTVARHWKRARAFLRRQETQSARAEFEAMRTVAPDDARTHWLAASFAWREGRAQVGAQEICAAAQEASGDPELACDVAEVAWRIGETAAAHSVVQQSGWDDVDDVEVLRRYADLRQQLGEPALALIAVNRLLKLRPGSAPLHCARGQQLESLGRLDDAGQAYRRCLDLDPTFGHAACRLARLPRQAGSLDVRKRVREGCLRARSQARMLEDFEFAQYYVSSSLGDYAAAWSALISANGLVHAELERHTTGQEAHLDRVRRAVTGIRPSSIPAARHDEPVPIFIIGMPRSGSTMLAQMLGNHPAVVNCGELIDFGMQLLHAADVCSDHDEQFYARLPYLDFLAVGKRYLNQTAWRRSNKRFFIDKLPSNWIVVRAILAALPNARILHLRRDPLDGCFSAWCTHFGGMHGWWTYSLSDLAAHYLAYRAHTRRWPDANCDAILDVSYEELVRAPVVALKRVFSFCGMPWEAGCEDLTRNNAAVSTASAAQIREPVHTRSIGTWRPYENELGPLRAVIAT